jgi:hypothetical protein
MQLGWQLQKNCMQQVKALKAEMQELRMLEMQEVKMYRMQTSKKSSKY